MEKEELNRLILEQIEKISDNVEFQNEDVLKKAALMALVWALALAAI